MLGLISQTFASLRAGAVLAPHSDLSLLCALELGANIFSTLKYFSNNSAPHSDPSQAWRAFQNTGFWHLLPRPLGGSGQPEASSHLPAKALLAGCSGAGPGSREQPIGLLAVLFLLLKSFVSQEVSVIPGAHCAICGLIPDLHAQAGLQGEGQ